MPLPRCTIDTSCIIALDHLNLLPQLSFLFSGVLLPKAVRRELFKRRRTKDRLRGLLGSFIHRCDDYDKAAVDSLLAERVALGVRDRGEAEAVVQAAKVGARVVVDDPWGRKLAGRYDLEHYGTLEILRRFLELKLLSASTLRTSYVELRRRGIRLPWDTVNEILREVGQQPLPSSK
jgi:predicted nucleic acid-binding protein